MMPGAQVTGMADRTPGDIPVTPFKNQQAWESWLAKNHARSAGVWVKLAKKGSARDSVTYDEALESALCYGWIDGQKKPFDETWWLQKFTPRGKKSIWSVRNRDKAEALIAAGRMAEPGMKAVEAAKADGRWDSAYEGQRNAVGAGRPAEGAGPQPEGKEVLRRAGQREQVRNPLPDPSRERRQPVTAHPPVRGNARARGEDPLTS